MLTGSVPETIQEIAHIAFIHQIDERLVRSRQLSKPSSVDTLEERLGKPSNIGKLLAEPPEFRRVASKLGITQPVLPYESKVYAASLSRNRTHPSERVLTQCEHEEAFGVDTEAQPRVAVTHPYERHALVAPVRGTLGAKHLLI
jgi:hypothetical protein